MKKKRKVFIVSWFYFIFWIIVCLGLSIFCIIEMYEEINNGAPIWQSVIIGAICLVSIAMMVFIGGRFIWQWVVIDENDITFKVLFGVICVVKWNELVEIQCAPAALCSLNAKIKWFVFIDNQGNKVCIESPIIRIGECIKIKASKRTREFLLQLKPDLKFTEYKFK